MSITSVGKEVGNWTIRRDDVHEFAVYQPRGRDLVGPRSDAFLNGLYPTKADALRKVIEEAETERKQISAKICRAKAMLRRAVKSKK